MRRALILVLLAASAAHADSLSITATTQPAPGGTYAPNNVVAVWIQDAGGTFVKTIQRWGSVRQINLLAWIAKAGNNDADAISGATRPNHATPLSITWDLKDKNGTIVPDGTYTIRMEVADSNAASTAQNNEGTFTFTKGPTAQNQPGLSNGGFTNVTIDFQLSVCGNGMLESGETCDPIASCPTSCAQGTDACMPNVLMGDAATCTAECVVQQITTCVNDDGCCPPTCTAANDNDCTAGGGGNQQGPYEGGCGAAGGSLGISLAAVGLVLLRRRRGALVAGRRF